MANDSKEDPTKITTVVMIDDAPTFDVFERWGVPPNTVGKLTRYGAPYPAGELVQLTVPTKLLPRIVAALSDPNDRADFLACIGGKKTAAMAE
jgi:hypothetical protein